jgi:hypothetical protein
MCFAVTESRYDTSRGNVVALAATIQSYDVDPAPLLRQAGVDLEKLDASSRVPGKTVDDLICLAVDATGDAALGLRFVDFLQPTSYHALGMSLLYSPTLRSFCERLERFFAAITTMDATRFVADASVARLVTESRISHPEVAWRVHGDAWAAWVTGLIRQMYRPEFTPRAVALVWAPPRELLPRYEAVFRCPLRVSPEEPYLELDSAILDEPLPTSNAELARQGDQIVAGFLAGIGRENIPSQMQGKLVELLPSGECSKQGVASALNMITRTLQNKLDRAGTSYQELLDSTRRELAREYLEQETLSVSEVAILEAREDVGLETSYGNGGLLSAALCEPWNQPGISKIMIPALLGGKNSMLRIHPRALPSLAFWGLKFLRNSSADRSLHRRRPITVCPRIHRTRRCSWFARTTST